MAAVDVDVLTARAEWLGSNDFLRVAGLIAESYRDIGASAEVASARQAAMAVAAAGAATSIAVFLGRAALAAGEDEAAFARAANSFRAAGQAFPVDELTAFTAQLERQTGIADDAIAGTVGLLGTFQLTKQQAMELTPAILDTAEALKAQGVTAEQTAVQVGKALQTGNVGALRRVGIVIEDADIARLGIFGAVMEGLKKNGEGAAATFRNTLPGALQAASTAFGSLQEAIGEPLIKPLTAIANMAATVAEFLRNVPGAATAIAIGMGGAAAAMAYYAVTTAWAFRETVKFTAALARQGTVAGTTATATAAAAGGGLLGKAKGLLRGGGVVGTAAAIGGGLLIEKATEGQAEGGAAKQVGGFAQGALSGAVAGAALGSIVPVIGNVAGGLIGAAIGGVLGGRAEGLFGGAGPAQPTTEGGKIAKALDDQTQILKNIEQNTAGAIGNRQIEDLVGLGRARRELMRALG